jgi:hypothetical protein
MKGAVKWLVAKETMNRRPFMSKTTITPFGTEIQVEIVNEKPLMTRYAGALAWQEVWAYFDVPTVLAESEIRYGQEKDLAQDLMFGLSLGPLVNAHSVRRIAQRFGGEASQDDMERDELLAEMVEEPFNQRKLSRFTNTVRYDWERFNYMRLQRLQQIPGYAPDGRGILIVDDVPLAKPFAKEMDYLQPVWDNNLKRTVKGYSAVHLRYHHPHRPDYSLHLEPWRKTSATGEAKSKQQARRRAQAGEERSKLDIALDAIIRYQDLMADVRTVIADSWYTARWFIYELRQLGLTFIGEADSKQKFEVGDDYLTVPELHQRLVSRLKQVKGMKHGVRATSLQATIRPDTYTPEAQSVRLVLVEGLHKPRDNDKGYHLLVCSCPQWTTKRIVSTFQQRPLIEQVHRQGKQHEGWLSFHCRNYPALQCHLATALLRSTLFALLARFADPENTYSPAQMLEHWFGCVAPLHLADSGSFHIQLPLWFPTLGFLLPQGIPPPTYGCSLVNVHTKPLRGV